jgi:DNA polymerase I-like protein with 3'-5' exonuclease and polymerase domains
MLRLACCEATEQDITVCAPVHDALLIEAPLEEIDGAVRRCQEIMCEASMVILDVFPLRTEALVIRYPDRYMDKRGKTMWEAVWELI